ncbi:c-type cytochrome [Anaerobacillus isosaccharinicus]|uniref:Cytochrome c n=1 Tax=Anaerobacillus isosaccharinicus TaxID=1532552 RepID=A0A1S2LUP9_9BACI|nr:cytochrome c [Anaerobacillus isosaccharinicus]MBA5587980.1 cytochrome c [Anaerobacillus isosaccharinicus]QOY33873.1 cytochrome c [Anaerobacillus isosaccharinicus]
MKKAIILIASSLFLVACNSEAATLRENETITLFNKNCAGCHGLELNGTGLASGIRGLKKNDILHSIINGDEGMEANILTGENAERVATWVSKQK